MRRMSTKRNLVLLLLVLAIALSFVLAACSGGGSGVGGGTAYNLTLDRTSISLDKGQAIELSYQLTKNGEIDTESKVNVSVNNNCVTYDAATGKLTAKESGIAVVTLTVDADKKVTAKLNVSIPEYTISIKGAGDTAAEVNLGSEEVIEYGVYRDGILVKDKKVNVTVIKGLEEGAATVTYKEIGNRLNFIAQGEAAVKVELADDPTVFATKTYRITKSFWSSDKQVNKSVMQIVENGNDDDYVIFPGGGGNQYFLGVMEGGSKYVFSADLKIPTLTTSHSIGLGHTLNTNDNSLWFGLKSASSGNGYRIYVKDYYNGWGVGKDMFPDTYDNIIFDSDVVSFTIVRDGQNYWYNIGGYVGTYTSTNIGADAESWAGVYAQEQALTITNFKYATDDEAIDEAKAACEVECIKLTVANAGVNKLVKGTTYVYNATKVCRPGTNPEITWELDKTGMTNGAEGTTIVNGAITLDADAAGTAVVIAKCGEKEVRINVEILQTSLADENDMLTVDGGVTINEDGSIEFPEMYNAANATLSATDYGDEYYSAKLKSTVKGDFELSFKITDLKTVAGSCYLVSLGEKYGNFMFTRTGVTLVAPYAERADYPKFNKSGDLSATFEAAEEYEVTIAVVKGFYKVTVNGTELVFGGNATRRIEDYTVARNVLITTKAGTSMVVSDITLIDKPDADYILLTDKSQALTEGNGFESGYIANDWGTKNDMAASVYYGGLLPDGDYTMSMNVMFNNAATDSKFAVQIGKYEFHICNKLAGGDGIQGLLFFNNNWGEAKRVASVTAANKTFKVTVKKIGNDIYFHINGELIGKKTANPADLSNIAFTYTFDWSNVASPAGTTVKVTDWTVNAGAAVISVSGPDGLQKGTTSTAYTATVIGSTSTPVWTLDDSGLTAGTATWNADNTLTLSSDAAGSVVVTATVGDESASITVGVTEQPADQNTALAESKGGVKQDVATGTLIFDDPSKNGVADEGAYSEGGEQYYAILNTAANTRAVIHDNFELEFTVSDYATTAQYPKLMISLGGKNEQFYVVYFADGRSQIQTFINSVEVNNPSNAVGGQWVNSPEFSNFNQNMAHTYKIKCQNAVYTMYLDGNEITGFNMNGQERQLLRNPHDIVLNSNIMISTNSGTTATVSNIKLTQLGGDTVVKTMATNISVNDNGDAQFTFIHRDWNDSAAAVYTYGAVGDNCVITFDVKFSDNMSDGKLCVRLDGGVNAYTICLENGNMKVEVRDRWGGAYNAVLDYTQTLKVKITIVDGVANMVINETYVPNNDGITSQGALTFYTHNTNSADYAKTVTVSNITVTNA